MRCTNWQNTNEKNLSYIYLHKFFRKSREFCKIETRCLFRYTFMTMSNEKKNPELCHWADQMADRIIKERGDLDLYTCASGITPSANEM